LEWLTANASKLGIGGVGTVYWGTGLLSSILDNAPTYLSFLTAAGSTLNLHSPALLGSEMALNFPAYLRAISFGAVFFGGLTYIGNGPNFLVRSIAEEWGVEMPTFFGYLFKYAVPFLLPVLTAVWLLFF
jgi:Na+/H+ antiporter NhaD/arsenite permease-like protein